MEMIHVTFDELTGQTAHVHSSSGPAPNLLTPGPISSGLVPTSAPTIPYVPPTNKELELLFQLMFDEYFETTTGYPQMPPVLAAQASAIPTGPSVSISFDRDAPSGSHSPSSSAHQSSSVHHGVATEHSFEVNPFAATEHAESEHKTTILQGSSAIHHISNIDNFVHQIIEFQSILITSSSQSFGHQKGVCPWLTENHFNSQYLKHWAINLWAPNKR
ncbi:hypothetical protein Tco_1250833 [Tanacetum coccineum]